MGAPSAAIFTQLSVRSTTVSASVPAGDSMVMLSSVKVMLSRLARICSICPAGTLSASMAAVSGSSRRWRMPSRLRRSPRRAMAAAAGTARCLTSLSYLERLIGMGIKGINRRGGFSEGGGASGCSGISGISGGRAAVPPATGRRRWRRACRAGCAPGPSRRGRPG